MLLATKRHYQVTLLNGQVRLIHPISLSSREELKNCLETCYERMCAEQDTSKTFEQLYDEDKIFQFFANRAIELNGLSPTDLSLDELYPLILPYVDTEGNPHNNGVLIELNYANLDAHSKNAEGKDTSYLDVMAVLWSNIGSLQETLNIAGNDKIPADELITLVNKYAKLMSKQADPQKAMMLEKQDEILDELKEIFKETK